MIDMTYEKYCEGADQVWCDQAEEETLAPAGFCHLCGARGHEVLS